MDDNPYERAEPFLPPIDELGLDGYDLEGVLGEGGFGRVYRARQSAFDRDVAIKVLAASGFREETARRFERECRAVGALSGHPNIVTIYDSGITRSGRPYIVMDHMAGGSLGDLLERGTPLAWSDAVDIIIKIAGAVETAHRSGILHRDIKPENVLLSAFKEPKLADFGVASIPGGYQTHTGAITASLSHAAPEVLEGHKATRAVDIYALGSTLFALIAGSAAFENEEGAGLQSLIAKTLTQPVPDLRAKGVPDEICAVIETAMAKDPAERFASADQFGAALQAAQATASIPITEMPIPPAASSIITYATDLADPTEGARTSIRERRELTPPSPPPRRRRVVWRSPVTAGVIALLLLASSTGVVALRDRRGDTATPAAAPSGSAQAEDAIASEEPSASDREIPTRSERGGKQHRKNTNGGQGGASYGGSYGFGGGSGSSGGSGGGSGSYAPPSSGQPGPSGGGTGAGGGSGGGTNEPAPKPPPPPPPNEQPATVAFYHYSNDDGTYLFTANQALADDQRSRYRYHQVIAAVWAKPGTGLIQLCPHPDRCEAYVSGNPPKKGSYKTLYVYEGAHGRFFTTDPSSIPSGSNGVVYGYAR